MVGARAATARVVAVVPTYNRRDNLGLLLASLAGQTYGDFVVVVADDGSTDGTRELVGDLAGCPEWHGRLIWVGCGTNQGVRTGRARNIGAGNVPSGTPLLLMLDSDLVLPPFGLERLVAGHERHPDGVAVGRVDWLPPLEPSLVRCLIDRHGIAALRRLVPGIPSRRMHGTFVGPELRALFHPPPDHPVAFRPEWALPLLTMWPVELYWQVGGFDERMRGYGYQDNEMGIRSQRAGVTCLPVPEAWSLHMWHRKHGRAMVENQRNLDYVLRRHGPQPALEVDVDWSWWWHYHAERGGRLLRSPDGATWAVNRQSTHRLRLDDASWAARLGLAWSAPAEAVAEVLDSLVEAGTAHDPPEVATSSALLVGGSQARFR